MTSRLPARRSALVGREAELEEVAAAMAEHRLVTLLGVGGVGKSSLAIEAARPFEAASTVRLVDLAVAQGPGGVEALVADRLGLGTAPDVEPLDAVAAALSDGDHLLLLDNCERVVDPAADLVDALLDRCPDLRVLATSRVRLEVEGERVLPVPPLRVEDEPGHPSPATTLLLERARTAGVGSGADRASMAELARRLDGVPLAIELAAARLGEIPLSSLLEQLDDRLSDLAGRRRGVERHQSLASVLEWSVDLLDETSRAALRVLSVFVGGFTLEGALAVVGPEADTAVRTLVAASLLEWDETEHGPRYRMLEMIRAFGRDGLREAGAVDEVARRHAEYLAAWVLEAQVQLRSPAEPAWVPRLRQELADLGAALRWAAASGELRLVDDLACGLGDHVFSRAGREVHDWIDEAIDALADPFEIEDLTMLAVLSAQRRGDLPEMRRLLDLAGSRGHRGLRFVQSAESARGVLAIFEGRPDDARVAFARAAEEARGVAPVVETMATGFGALAQAYGGDHRGAHAAAVETARIAEELGWPTGQSAAAYCEAETLIAFDRPAALQAYRRAAELSRRVDNHFFGAVNLVSWASAEARFGDPADAFDRFAEALEYFGALGSWSYLSTLLRNLSELLVRVERYEDGYVLRAAVRELAGSAGLSGVDLSRDAYLCALLEDRLVVERQVELDEQVAELTRDGVLDLARAVVDAEVRRRRDDHPIRAVVFTDLEGATSFMAERGDREAREIMRRYEELTLELLERHGGQRVKGTGDGMLLLFPSISAALRCLRRLQQEVAQRSEELPLRVRAGVHAGELIDETTTASGDDIHGTVVNLTARVVDRADGGEIVLSDTARQIVVGADLTFTPLGPAQLKGIAEPVPLHRYEWRQDPGGAVP